MTTPDVVDSFPPNATEDIHVEDRGSPVTVFAFAGAMKRVGMIPIFEFGSALRRIGGDYNLVLLRDVHRSYYQLRNDGLSGGLDDYADRIQDLMSRLGGVHHVAIGASMGAAAALYFGARCRMQHVIAFAPNWPIGSQVGIQQRLRNASDLGAFLRSPRGYSESVAVMAIARFLYRRLKQSLGMHPVDPMVSEYRDGSPTCNATVYYSTRCPVDVRNVKLIAECPHVQLVPVAMGVHNIAGYFKQQGLLFHLIRNEIDGGYLRTLTRDAEPDSSTVPPEAR